MNATFYKTFKERQHSRRAAIGNYKHWLSVAISNNEPLHGTLHHATKCQAIMWFPHISWYELLSLKPGPSLSRNISKFRATRQNDLLNDTVHHPTKFQADSWKHYRVRTETSSLRPGPILSWKFQSSVKRVKIDLAWPFKWWSASWYFAFAHKMSGKQLRSIKSGNVILYSWYTPLITNFKVPWNMQKLVEQGHIK